MSYMFYGASSFEDTESCAYPSNVEDERVFGIRSWDTRAVKHTDYMFVHAEKFKSDLSSWNLSGLESKKNMFQHEYLLSAEHDAIISSLKKQDPQRTCFEKIVELRNNPSPSHCFLLSQLQLVVNPVSQDTTIIYARIALV